MKLKLNLGCGNDIQNGYVNIDLRKRQGVTVHDLNKPLPYENGSVEEVRAIDIVEHFDRFKVKEIIADWCRVLKPGGKMLLKTPDVKQICERYYPQAKAGKISWERLSAVINGGQDYPGNFHHVTFSFEWLGSLLAENGMIDIKKIEHPNQNMSVQATKG